MLADTRIISRHKDYAVLQERQAIAFRDRSVAYLHQVQRDICGKHGERHVFVDTFHRAICLDGAHWCVFDLRSIHSSFSIDFASLPPRDHSGIVLYTLRAHFAGDAEFVAFAFREFAHVWTTLVDGIEPLIIAGDAHHERLVFQPELRRAA